MFRILFFIIVFYFIYKGFKIFIKVFSKDKSTSYTRGETTATKDKNNIEEAEFTEIESKIHTRDENKVDGAG